MSRDSLRRRRVVLGWMTMTAAVAMAGEGLEAGLDTAVNSAYVWRGQVLNTEAVMQPSLTVKKSGFSLNWWGSLNLTDKVTGQAREFSEHDITAAYSRTCPLTGADLSAGVVQYDFPNQSITGEDGNASLVNDTREVYLSAGYSKVLLSPALQVNYDFKEAKGFYGLFSLSHAVEVCQRVVAAASASIGAADSDYNEFYFGVSKAQLNDGSLKFALPISLCSTTSLVPSVQYMTLLDTDIRDGAKKLYGRDDRFLGGVTLSCVF